MGGEQFLPTRDATGDDRAGHWYREYYFNIVQELEEEIGSIHERYTQTENTLKELQDTLVRYIRKDGEFEQDDCVGGRLNANVKQISPRIKIAHHSKGTGEFSGIFNGCRFFFLIKKLIVRNFFRTLVIYF